MPSFYMKVILSITFAPFAKSEDFTFQYDAFE
jgi:hypothetical protein